jgi:hypothetical protein
MCLGSETARSCSSVCICSSDSDTGCVGLNAKTKHVLVLVPVEELTHLDHCSCRRNLADNNETGGGGQIDHGY